MKNHLYRNILIGIVLLFTCAYIYPTIGWMLLSDEARAEHIAKWAEEDSVYHKPNLFADAARGIRRWAQFDNSKIVNLGLDLKGGVHMVVGFDLTEEQEKEGMTNEVIQDRILRQIQRRVHDFEATEPIIQSSGDTQIEIQLPGEQNIERARNLIKKTAHLTFHIVSGRQETVQAIEKVASDARFKDKFSPFLSRPRFMGGPFRVEPQHYEQVNRVVEQINQTTDLLPEGKTFFFSQPPNEWDDEQSYELYLMDTKPAMSGEGLRLAVAREDDSNPGKYQILFEFDSASGNEFGKVTEENIGRSMAILVDGVVVSAPNIESRITTSGRITGNFSGEQAYDLAIALSSGSLPVPIREEFSGVVSASLGTDSIRAGLYASIAGLAAVAMLMIALYRVAGLIACFALFLNGLIMLAAFAYFRITLTLPGIAGFVLTMGMAVDANVLIFERVREEVRNGKTLLSAIELGYERATVTILDSNITTLIAAIVLLQFGTGPVQGFGVALAIGIFTSVFTALLVSKAIFDLLTARGAIKQMPMLSIINPDTKIPFIQLRNKAFAVSIALILVSVVAFFGRGYENNFGVDFKPGTSLILQLESDSAIDVGQVRQQLTAGGFGDAVVQAYGDAEIQQNLFAIRTSATSDAPVEGGQPGASVGERIQKTLAPLVGDTTENVKIEREQSVGAAIGSQLRRDALSAVFFALLFMIAYMWFRYNLVFGVTAVIALLHDAIISVGMLTLFGVVFDFHIDMTVIAAVLTIIGYSINDTVVIFDRIRENLRAFAGRDLDYVDIMNMAINQTLGRTILTSTSTFLAVLMLLLFGGKVLRDFSFCLIVGIVVGTYSTVFVATSLAYLWQSWSKHHLISGMGKGHVKSHAAQTRKRGSSKAATQ